MEEVIDLASDDKFSEFSKKVKQSLEDKLRNNVAIKDNASKMDKFTDMANKFKEIATKEEPAKVDDTKVDDTKVDDTKVDDGAAPTEPNSED